MIVLLNVDVDVIGLHCDPSCPKGRLMVTDSPDLEIDAMTAIAKALDTVKSSPETLGRVLRWAGERYGVKDMGPVRSANGVQPAAKKNGVDQPAHSAGGEMSHSDVAELFTAADPKTEWQKAIVVGYWIMKSTNQADFASADVNSQLKNLGHGASNITDALGKAMRQKPALVIQTSKTGSAKQARKKYKLTKAGMTAVEALIRGDSASGGQNDE